ncbi:toxic anion resistance protein [Leptogranulimonas caecicola]|uniref:Tellurium resistance protein n=1 Tax=Leptogranulimonas caecicola TaxID=2894156 RepID=A0AAU9D0W7_9ACTN|nr:toxic anion resistance protein [Leptogranulimonas caecicola]BDC90695.1 tellurium resistance protein [Leptogranulimonas caecicola]
MDDLNFDDVPQLTLSEVEEVQVTPTLVEEQPDALVSGADDLLSEAEKAQVDQFSRQIDVTNASQVLTYGSGAQKKMADFSQTALEKVRTKDLDEVGDLITGVVGELRGFEVEDEKGFLGFFRRGANKVENLKNKYDKAENSVNKIVASLQEQQISLMKDTKILDKLYDLNLTYYKELTMYILAGKKRLSELKAGELEEAKAKALASGRTEDAEAVQKLTSAIDRFEKKLSDLELTRTIAMQTAPQIRFVQNNEMLMVEKIQTTIVNTIPLWKSQMVLALGIANADAAVRAQTAVTDMTNELLRKNSEKLKTTTAQIARENERGIVDIETLKHTNENLIQTFDEVMQIQQEGRQKRAEAERELAAMENDLRKKLLEIKQ